jgi:beta-glucosidase
MWMGTMHSSNIIYRILSKLMIASVILVAGCTNKNIPAYSNPELPVNERVENLLSLLTLEEKAGFLTGKDMWHIKGVERLGIPSIRLTDCGHGVTVVLDSAGHNSGCSTCFPTAVGQASTWNRELVREVGAAIGRETRALGAAILLAPMVNIHRTPLGGRNYETYSEDPFLTGTLASSFIQGVQSEHIGAVIKAATANNQQTNQSQHSVEVSERALREIYLPAFKIPVMESNPWGIMTSYNKVNGEYTSASKHLIGEIIKGEWQYPGFVVSDWRGTHSMKALFAGLDLEMPGPGKILTKDAILKEIEQGNFTEEELDCRVGRILAAIIKTKSLDNDESRLNSEWDTPRHHGIARKAAEEAIVLLKNKNSVLPLDLEDIETLAVIGPNAREARLGGGGSASVTACHTVSPLDGIKNYCKDPVRVLFEEGCGMKGDMPIIYTEYLSSMDGNHPVLGLRGEYFPGKELKGDPVLVRVDDKIDFSWGWAAPCREVERGDYSVRWTGKVMPPVTGEYKIGVHCTEGGVRFYLDGVLLIDHWGEPYNENFEAGFKKISESVRIKMQAGVSRDVRIEFHKKANRNSIRLEWEIPGKRDPIAEAVKIASESDVAIVFAGLSNLYEGGTQDRENLLLPEQQNKLISSVARANPNTIVVLINGTPMAMPWLEEVPAILEAYYPGQEGGDAIARILFGEVNPSGKLPETFPQRLEDNPSHGYFPGDPEKVNYGEGIYVGYRHYDKKNIEPLFPFGYGLSYTEFAYDNLQVRRMEDGSVTVEAEVKNTGLVPGKEVVQLYVRDLESSIDKPEKELKGFSKVFIEPGQTKPVSIKLNMDQFAHFDEQTDQWVVEPGQFELLIGSSSRDIRLREKITID